MALFTHKNKTQPFLSKHIVISSMTYKVTSVESHYLYFYFEALHCEVGRPTYTAIVVGTSTHFPWIRLDSNLKYSFCFSRSNALQIILPLSCNAVA